jgi:2,3-bisphosphoglycerate-independent phosphoglycerate mutase
VVEALVILDGAPEPLTGAATALEAAHTPALDALCAVGAVTRLATTPDGLPPGSETGIPTLLGAPPTAPVGRGLVEAAAAGLPVLDGQQAWRIDLHRPDGRRAGAAETAALARVLAARLPRHEVVHLRGHRLLAIGAGAPPVGTVAGLVAHVWGDGAGLPAILDARTVVVCAPGAAAGCAALLGACVATPDRATGDVDTDLGAKAAVAIAALSTAERVVVHVGGPDEAAHRRDTDAKRAAIEAADRELVAPLLMAVHQAGGRLAVTADHGTCSQTGLHDAAPVPLVLAGADVEPAGAGRLTERGVADARVHTSPWAECRGAGATA